MKRLFAILLPLAMLLPMGITTRAQEAEIEKKPFTLANWTVGTKEYTNVYYMPFIWSGGAKYRESIRNGEVVVCWREVGNVDTIPELAVKLKELFDTYPAGSKYTLIREMDFSAQDAFTRSYSIYSADGILLGKAENIPTAEMEIPVYSVNLSAKNITGQPLLIDDYRLYPTKVTTDFYLYDATTGMKIAEPEKAHNGNVGYRLSWLNTTAREKTYCVMAAAYNGETLVSKQVLQEVKLAPQADGVVTGVA